VIRFWAHMTKSAWPDFEGAVLDRVTLDWRNAQARIDFLPSAGSLTVASWIRAHDVRDLAVPMRRPNGASKHVHAVRRGEGRLEIEMKSGDVLTVEAALFAFERADG
jgi:hypothetical protein